MALLGTLAGLGAVGGVAAAGVGLAAAKIAKVASQQTPFKSGSTTYYPTDLFQGGQNQAFMLFNFYEYQRPSIYAPATIDTNPLEYVVLPLPSDLTDKLGLSYQDQTNSLAVGSAIEGAAAVMNQGSVSGLGGVAADIVSGSFLSGTNKVGSSFGVPLQKITQIAGMTQNPFLTVLFNSPQFKRFTFSWLFIPETQQDSTNLSYIIDAFKYHALPALDTSGLFLTYPDIVRPVIYPTGYMFDFKHCVLESVIPEYVPGETPGFKAGTLAPSAVRFTISLLEIEFWLKSDIIYTSTRTSGGGGTAAAGTTSLATGEVNPTTTGGTSGGLNSQTQSTTPNDPLGSSVTLGGQQ